MDIAKQVKKLIKRYETADPYRILKEKGIDVMPFPLGSLNGFYTENFRIPLIYINENLDEQEFYFTVCHELGHLVLGHEENQLYLSTKTRLKTSTFEDEANTFAVFLMLNQYDDWELPHINFQKLSEYVGFDVNVKILNIL